LMEGKPRESLITYAEPIEVPGQTAQFNKSFTSSSSKSKGTLPPLQGKPNNGNIMNAILPPREWLADDKHFI